MDNNKVDILDRALKRQKEARKTAEQILEQRSLELFNTSEELKRVNKQLEEVLDEKNTQLKGVFENINDAYLVMNLNGEVLKMNDIAERFFGYSMDESPNVVDLIYKEDYLYAMSSFQELIEKGKFSGFTARIITKEKKIKWVNINAITILDKNNQPIAAQGVIRDITEEREKQIVLDLINNIAQSILGKEEINEIASEISSKIAKYLNTNDCIIYLLDNDSKTLEQIAAYGQKQQKDNSIFNRIILPIGKGIVGIVAKTGKSEIIHDTSKDDRYILDDKIRYSEITVPIINNGEVIGIIDAEHEQKNYFNEDQLETVENIANLVALQLKSALNIRERKKVEDKNKELLEKLTRSNEELKEYAHIVSHDLKSPLRSIAALSSWIKMDNLDCFDKNSLEYFDDLEMTLEKMEGLISDVLKFSKVESKDHEEEVDLDFLVRDLIKMLYVPDNITVKILSKLPSVRGDKTKLQQIFQNLISNAVKFNNKENGIITIGVEDQNSFYKFTITDNGIGIDKKHFDKIFKIFQSLKEAKDSSGIGLSIVKKIVNLYQGEIWLDSEINKGTTFYFTLKK
uniref:PAS domain-containing sensor histidine kinase n=1 Tax=uncultured Polaribacter sp. TaxID=174711 RepID=UPI00262369EA|nr:ATP-binding protein [uncultured Polaribacter sp.]